MSKSVSDRLRRERDDARAEAATMRAALDKIQREASRRFEGKSCERCLTIESLAIAALRSSQHEETNEINLNELEKLLRKPSSK